MNPPDFIDGLICGLLIAVTVRNFYLALTPSKGQP